MAVSQFWLRKLDEIEGKDLPIVGGKSFRLAMLKQHGLTVLPGLVLTTHFFEAQLRHTKLIPLWAGSPDIAVTAEALSWLATVLKTKPLAKPLTHAFNSNLNLLFGPNTHNFAVRSSVIDEDQRDHTFAGIHLTELSVPRAALPIAITRCWASALSDSAIDYRQIHGMSIQGIKIAVLIQPMLSPQCSGVGFTLNPLTGAYDEMVIEAISGLGNPLVSGKIQPHFYRLAKQFPNFPLIEQRAEIPFSQKKEPLLSATKLQQLAHQLHQIEALMGEPQDVEWAKQDETLFFLQTRPVTRLQKPSQTADQTWTRGSYQEFLPEIPSPFWGSLLKRAQPVILDMFHDMGLETDNLGPYEQIIFGRPYLNLTLLKRFAAQIGLNLDGVLESIGYSKMTATNSPFSIDWRTAWQTRRIYHKIYRQIRTAEQAFEQMDGDINKLIDELSTGNPGTQPDVFLSQLRWQDKIYQLLVLMSLRLESGIALTAAAGSRLVAAKTVSPAAAITTLVPQQPSSKPDYEELHQELALLGQLAKDDKNLRAYLLNAPPNFSDYLRHPAVSSEFKRKFNLVLTRFGDQATYNADPGQPRYKEEPAVLLRIVRQLVKQGVPLTNTSPVLHQHTDTTPKWRQGLVSFFGKSISRLLLLRIRLNHTRAKSMTAVRQWNLALARHWVNLGWLEQVEDIFWLTINEIERTLVVGETAAVTLSSMVRVRKESRLSYEKTKVPFSLRQSQLPAIQFGSDVSISSPADVTLGLPISPGQARGTVVVVRHPDEVSDLTGDVILVMPSTGSNWLPLLHVAAGLIVETGGLLSHGSIIAREYGLPAVANIPQATQRFRTGDKVLLDGSTGVVQLLKPALDT